MNALTMLSKAATLFFCATLCGCGGEQGTDNSVRPGQQELATNQAPTDGAAEAASEAFTGQGDDTEAPTRGTAQDPTTDPEPAVPVPGNTIEVKVSYTGTEEGTLKVAVFTSYPPFGPPAKHVSEEDPQFPQTLTLEDVDAGTYHVVVAFDVNSDNPWMPGPEDLRVGPEEAVVSDTEGAFVAVTLTDAI